jgi:hypothetical protein
MTLQQHDYALVLYANLDHALRVIGSIDDESVDLVAARGHVGRALQALYRAFSAGAEIAAFDAQVGEAVSGCREALAVLQQKPTDHEPVLLLQETLARCLGILSYKVIVPPRPSQFDIPSEAGADAPPVVLATREEPTLVTMERKAILPSVVLLERPPPALAPVVVDESVEPDDTTLEALAAQAEAMLQRIHGSPGAPGRRAEKPPPAPTAMELDGALYGEQLSEESLLRRRAADFFEDLSMMGIMRTPDEGEVWTEMLDVERRLLARIDALLACGPDAWSVAVGAMEEAALEDPDYVWGAMMLYGSVGGDDTFDQLLRVVSEVDLGDEEMRARVADAWSFVPHPRAEAELLRWLRSSHAERVLVALHALGRRRVLSVDEALGFAAEQADPRVAREALLALALAAGRVEPFRLVDPLSRRAPEVLDAAMEAALAHGVPHGVVRARELVASDAADGTRAALWLALGGDERDFDALLRSAASSDAPVGLEAIGWYGHLGAVDFLIGRLRGGADDAVRALQRITAANLTDDDPAPDYADAPKPFERAAPPTYQPEPSLDADVWAAWWARWRHLADPSRRHRFGHPCGLRDLLWELREGWSAPASRRLVAMEASSRTTCRVPLDPRDFVPRQAHLIRGVAPILDARAHRWTDGRWTCEGAA